VIGIGWGCAALIRMLNSVLQQLDDSLGPFRHHCLMRTCIDQTPISFGCSKINMIMTLKPLDAQQAHMYCSIKMNFQMEKRSSIRTATAIKGIVVQAHPREGEASKNIKERVSGCCGRVWKCFRAERRIILRRRKRCPNSL
jgi:hypothetical protein